MYVRSEGLLGERYIELKPGTPGRPAVKDGGELLQGAPPADIDQLFTELSDVAAGIKNLTQMITQPAESGAGEAKQRGALQSIISNLEETSRSLNNVSQRLERGEGTLGKLLTDEAVYNQLEKTLADIGSAVQKISASEGTLAKLMQDDEIYNQLREADCQDQRHPQEDGKGRGYCRQVVPGQQNLRGRETKAGGKRARHRTGRRYLTAGIGFGGHAGGNYRITNR